MSAIGKRQSIVQLRRMLRRLDRSHSGDESGCPTCSLQRLAAQLVDELEARLEEALRLRRMSRLLRYRCPNRHSPSSCVGRSSHTLT